MCGVALRTYFSPSQFSARPCVQETGRFDTYVYKQVILEEVANVHIWTPEWPHKTEYNIRLLSDPLHVEVHRQLEMG